MKTTLIPAALLAGALALAACGSSDSPGTTPAAGGASSGTSSASSSSSSSSSAAAPAPGKDVDGATFGQDMVKAMTDAKSGKAALKISGGAAAAAASDFTMEFAFGDDQKMNMHATVKAATGSTEIIVVGGATYLKLPQAIKGKTWFKSSDAAAAAAADPTAIAKGFAGATVKDVGEEGDLHHYTLQTAGTDGVLDVYLDQDGRPAKLKGTTSGVTIDGTYSDWGADVSITAPPADQVTSTMG